MTPEYRSILITGGSSGIGEALALAYAAPGVHLCLTGRDAARLDSVAAACTAKGATVATAILDVSDAATMAERLLAWDDAHPFDLVIANAGISAGTGGHASIFAETLEQTRAINAVNIDGVANTVSPLIPRFIARRRGHISLMSSIASFRGLPGAVAYAASKAWVRSYGEGLRGALLRANVGVSVICPGFVTSRMTAVNDFPMPFLMDGARAARIIQRGIDRNRARIAFPWPMAFAGWLLSTLPPGWTDRMLAHAPRKKAR